MAMDILLTIVQKLRAHEDMSQSLKNCEHNHVILKRNATDELCSAFLVKGPRA